MDLPAALFPLGLSLGLDLLAVVLLALAAWRVPWRQLDPDVLNAWMGACVLVMLLWSLKGHYKAGLSFHLLGVAALTLLMGPLLALIASAVVLIGVCLAGGGDALALGMNWLICALVPVGVVTLALQLTQRYLPPNLFIYVFLNAFLASGVSLVLASLVGIGFLVAFGVYSWSALYQDVLPYYLLLSWSEAFTSGLMMVILIVYKPQWVSSFDDARYLND